MHDNAKKLALHEINWWKAHHRKQKKKLLSEMARLYALQFGLPGKAARKVVAFRVKAAREHDLAEAFEDKGLNAKAETNWLKARKLLEKHFELLLEKNA
ncbi:hypothetical protein HZB89_00670 [archaeon]|nr:hypothetical protein [archaeon]